MRHPENAETWIGNVTQVESVIVATRAMANTLALFEMPLQAPDPAQAPSITRLVEDYVLAEIREALMPGFAAENDARLTAMSRERSNVGQLREDLRRDFAQVRVQQTATQNIALSDGET